MQQAVRQSLVNALGELFESKDLTSEECDALFALLPEAMEVQLSKDTHNLQITGCVELFKFIEPTWQFCVSSPNIYSSPREQYKCSHIKIIARAKKEKEKSAKKRKRNH